MIFTRSACFRSYCSGRNQKNVSEEEKREILTMLTKMEKLTPDKVEESTSLVSTKFQNHPESLKENRPTTALWVQYFNMVTLMKEFIDTERGDWDGHIACVQQMIPFFHAKSISSTHNVPIFICKI